MTGDTDADGREHRRETVTAQGVFTRGPADEPEPEPDTEETAADGGESSQTLDRPSAQGVFERGHR